MNLRKAVLLLFFSFSLASCASQSTHWVSRSELVPAPDANIESVELVDGSVLEFNSSHGWYDAEKQIVEGVTITGWHPTIPIAKVRRVEIVEESSNVAGTIGIILLVLLGLGIIGGIEIASTLSRSGCLVLVQLAVVGAATMTVVLVLFL